MDDDPIAIARAGLPGWAATANHVEAALARVELTADHEGPDAAAARAELATLLDRYAAQTARIAPGVTAMVTALDRAAGDERGARARRGFLASIRRVDATLAEIASRLDALVDPAVGAASLTAARRTVSSWLQPA